MNGGHFTQRRKVKYLLHPKVFRRFSECRFRGMESCCTECSQYNEECRSNKWYRRQSRTVSKYFEPVMHEIVGHRKCDERCDECEPEIVSADQSNDLADACTHHATNADLFLFLLSGKCGEAKQS